MNRIVECVPNFSEGRRPEIVDAIVDAILSMGDVYLLDREMDADHNRSVITIAGPPETIGEAAFRGIEAAVRHIDLTRHEGAHPRIGAADVVPFVPIRGVSLDECVEIARYVGRMAAEKLHIPVYLYEAAATRPDRVNLENIRRGQFEGLRDEITTNVDRKPDFGDSRIHPTAGATVIGARKPLIAYNINLDTPDVAVAKQIAKKIRFSGGGFPFVKAMGVLLKDRGQAQVSMNLTDFEQTSLGVVFEAVRREAESLGAAIVGSEIVGLIPQKALDQAAESYLKVENFKPSMILENRVAEVIARPAADPLRMAEQLRPIVERVASSEAVPGGGSVAAIAGALGSALGQMTIRITKEKKHYRQHAHRYELALNKLVADSNTLLELIDKDAEAFNQVMQAYKLPKESPVRNRAIQDALIAAIETPRRTAQHAVNSMRIIEDLREIIHSNVMSDFQVSIQMLRAAIRGAIANMQINIAELEDPSLRENYQQAMSELETL